jgi:uncharacterized damage-inducible protein DinB
MKKISSLLVVLFLFSFSYRDVPLSQKEKDYATNFLGETQQAVFDAVKDLSAAQLKFKSADDKWSVEDCVKHIAVSEKNLWSTVESSLKLPPNPELRAEIKMTDEQVVKGTADRSNKVKTSDAFKPENTPFKSSTDALEAFKIDRQKLITYIKNSNDDMRNHVSALPFGNFDAYQMVLLISAHTKRHIQQIEEVKADPGFPKTQK